MKQKLLITVVSILVLNSYCSSAQSASKPIELRKGEVFDILLLQQKSGKENELKSYFQSAVSVAKRMSYQSLGGFKIKAHIRGNIKPDALILAKWENLKKRESFLTEIIKEVPNFHERRRDIWSYFGMRYYNIKNDYSFEIKEEKFHVATAYWLGSKEQESKYYKKWKKEISNYGGEILIELKDGKSAFGYQYNPDLFVISSWHDEAAFKTFVQNVENSKLDNISHLNQFILE